MHYKNTEAPAAVKPTDYSPVMLASLEASKEKMEMYLGSQERQMAMQTHMADLMGQRMQNQELARIDAKLEIAHLNYSGQLKAMKYDHREQMTKLANEHEENLSEMANNHVETLVEYGAIDVDSSDYRYPY